MAGQTEDEARCLVLAAMAGRLGAAVSAAQTDAAAAVRLLPAPPSSAGTSGATPDVATSATTSTAVHATAELAESLVAAGRPAAAAEEYTSALERLSEPPADPLVRAVLLRKRGLAYALADGPDAAVDDLDAAARLFADGGLPRARRAVLVEAATLASERPTPERGAWHRRRARAAAAEAADYDALADLDLLDARQAVARGDLESAIGLTVRARQRALDGVSAVKYLSAAIALADLHNLRHDREGAYEALSTAWATLGDLMGPDAGRTVVQPRLQLLVDEWGVDEFRAVKLRYETRRRAELRTP